MFEYRCALVVPEDIRQTVNEDKYLSIYLNDILLKTNKVIVLFGQPPIIDDDEKKRMAEHLGKKGYALLTRAKIYQKLLKKIGAGKDFRPEVKIGNVSVTALSEPWQGFPAGSVAIMAESNLGSFVYIRNDEVVNLETAELMACVPESKALTISKSQSFAIDPGTKATVDIVFTFLDCIAWAAPGGPLVAAVAATIHQIVDWLGSGAAKRTTPTVKDIGVELSSILTVHDLAMFAAIFSGPYDRYGVAFANLDPTTDRAVEDFLDNQVNSRLNDDLVTIADILTRDPDYKNSGLRIWAFVVQFKLMLMLQSIAFTERLDKEKKKKLSYAQWVVLRLELMNDLHHLGELLSEDVFGEVLKGRLEKISEVKSGKQANKYYFFEDSQETETSHEWAWFYSQSDYEYHDTKKVVELKRSVYVEAVTVKYLGLHYGLLSTSNAIKLESKYKENATNFQLGKDYDKLFEPIYDPLNQLEVIVTLRKSIDEVRKNMYDIQWIFLKSLEWMVMCCVPLDDDGEGNRDYHRLADWQAKKHDWTVVGTNIRSAPVVLDEILGGNSLLSQTGEYQKQWPWPNAKVWGMNIKGSRLKVIMPVKFLSTRIYGLRLRLLSINQLSSLRIRWEGEDLKDSQIFYVPNTLHQTDIGSWSTQSITIPIDASDDIKTCGTLLIEDCDKGGLPPDIVSLELFELSDFPRHG